MKAFDSLRFRLWRYKARRRFHPPTQLSVGLRNLSNTVLYTIVVSTIALVSPAHVSADSWRRVSTEHFEIIYSADDPFAADAAAEVTALAPSVWAKTTSYMRYTPSERVPVVLRSDTALANGYFTPLPPHIELFVSAPSRYQLGSRTSNWLELVFTHEMVHYLHLTRPTGFFGVASRVFGPLTAAGSYLFMPGWAVEAPTVYGETILTPGGRGADPFFEMTWLAPIYADDFYSYDQAGYQPPLPPGGRIYAAGYLMADYLHRTYGGDGYHVINDAFMRWPFLGMRRAVRRVTGTPAPSVFADMISEIELRSAGRFALDGGIPVSPTDINADWHLIGTTEAGILAWSAGPRAPGAVYLLSADGSSPPRHLFSVSPTDASSVAVDSGLTQAVAAIVHPDYTGSGPRVSYSDLHIIDLSVDGRPRSRRVTRNRQLLHPAFIPNSDAVIAVERQGQYSRLVRVAIDTGEIVPIYEPSSVRLHAPQVSPDGAVVAVVEHRQGSQDIVVLSVHTGSVLARIGNPEHHEFDPRFTADSAPYRVTYGSDEPGYLVVKEASFTSGDTPHRVEVATVIRDPIAGYSAVQRGDFYVYQTYRDTGYAIRKQRVTAPPSTGSGPTPTPIATPSGPTSVVATPESPGSTSSSGSTSSPPARALPIDAQRFVDLPRPVFWFPTVGVRGGSNEDPFTEFGIYALAASVLERHQFEIAAAYNQSAAEPVGELTYTFQPRAAAWTATASRQVVEDEDDLYTPEYALSLDVERPLWYRRQIDRVHGLVGSVGTIYEEDGERQMAFRGALRLFGTHHGASGLFFGGSGGEILSRVSVAPQILDRSNEEIATQTRLSQRWRIGRSRLYLQPNVTFASSRTEDAIDALPFVAGRFDGDSRNAIVSAPNALLGNATISIDVGPYDAAYRGLGSSASALSLFVEQAAVPGKATVADMTEGEEFSNRRTSWRPLHGDTYTTLGTALGVDLFFNTIPIRLTGGVALRVPHAGSDGASGVRFFLNIGGIAADRVRVER